MYLTYGTVLAFLSLFSFISASELDYDGWLQVRLYHSFDDLPVPQYTERGNVTISSIRSGAAIVAQPSISNANVDKLSKLAENGSKYRLKAVVKTSSGSETTFLSSVLACNLVGSNLQDTLYIWLDSTAEPVAINLISRGPCSQDTPATQMWTTEVQVKYPDGGPIPDTATYIQKIEREKQARESGEVKDNRSFFAKYWMYIVPALIFFVLTSATNPEAGGAGGGGGGGAQR
ncbi:ER membrane protein complex subunit 10 [Nasonia vitripennis]|uniref:ER membrane protein complex subunit 10 n=1 Tax=Nasonia vitripennis TaxID=7425 RepID=A0A7M7LM59_NASVI|nr:ER membrane protein complex subunit 10 [Nasonia vitripennis]